MITEWKTVRLGDATSILGDGLHGTPKYDESGEYYFINGNNLVAGKIEFNSTTKKTSKSEYLKYKKELTDKTILVSINGTIGNVALYNGENVVLGKSACYFNVIDDVDKYYVMYVLTGYKFNEYLNSLATGSTIKNVSLKLMRDFEFPLPPKIVQKSIAKILKGLDDKIENNRRMNETLEAMARALFKDWFVDFGPVRAKMEGREPPGLTAEVAGLFPDSLDEKGLPIGWPIQKMGENFNIIMGQSPPGESYNEAGDGTPFYQGRTDFGFRFPFRRKFCTQPTRFANSGDTLVSVRAPVGDLNLAWEKCCIGRGVASVRHREGLQSFTYYSIGAIQEQLRAFEHSGTIFGAINKKQFEDLSVVDCGLDIASVFENIVGPIDAKILANSDEIFSLVALRERLLPELLSGNLSVKGAMELLKNV